MGLLYDYQRFYDRLFKPLCLTFQTNVDYARGLVGSKLFGKCR